MKKITCGEFRRTISVLTILIVIFSLVPIFPARAVAPAGTLTGTVITVDIGQILANNLFTVTDAGVEILAATDLCVRIPAAVNANWDIADTTATFGGTAAAKAGTVTYPTAKILKVDITANFLAAETLTISALSYVGHTAASAATALDWSVDNTACTGAYAAGNANTQITVADGAEDTLTGVTTTLTRIEPTVASNHTVAFTVPATGVITRNGNVKVTFPAGFNVAGATAGALTGIDGTVVLAVAMQVVTLARQDNGTNSTAGAKSVVINNIINPVAGGDYTLTVRTDTSGDELLATATSASFTTQPAGTSGGSPPTDSSAPVSEIIDPKANATIEAGTLYTIKGTAIDFGGSLVAKVEISFNGGESWEEAKLKGPIANIFSWEYVWQNPTAGDYTIKSRATDSVGNKEIGNIGIKVSVVAPSAPPTEPSPPTVELEKPISQMTKAELEAKIIEVQQKIVELMQQLIQLLQEEIQKLLTQ